MGGQVTQNGTGLLDPTPLIDLAEDRLRAGLCRRRLKVFVTVFGIVAARQYVQPVTTLAKPMTSCRAIVRSHPQGMQLQDFASQGPH